MTNKSNHALCTLGIILMLSSCFRFESIEQPEVAEPNSTFEIDVSISFPDAQDNSYHESHYSILLPSEWNSEDSLFFSGTLSGVYLFSEELSDTMEIQDPAPVGYTWWTYMASATVDTLASEGGMVSFTQSVQPGATTGLFFIDYCLEFPSSGYFSHYQDKDNPLWLGTDNSPIAADVFVDPNGDDNNSGLSPEDPLKTISAALLRIEADSLNKRKIILADGEYKSSNNGEHFPLNLMDDVSLVGESQASVILDAEDRQLVLFLDSTRVDTIMGLTIRGGTCCEFIDIESNGMGLSFIPWGGGGVYARNSLVHFEDVTVSDNSNTNAGGGIEAYNSSVSMKNVAVLNNTTENNGGGISYDGQDTLKLEECLISGNFSTLNGGGLSLEWQAKARLESVRFANNTAIGSGGAIQMVGTYVSLTDVTITENVAAQGGGLNFGPDAWVDFDTTERCNIFLNEALQGPDLAADSWIETQLITVDTFTVLHPTDYHVSGLDNFTFDILNAKVQQVDQDLYVSTQGSNHNSGTSSNDPLRNISRANSMILPNHTIFLSNGTYSPSSTGESFPLWLISNVTLEGESEAGVVLDAEGQGSGVVKLDHDNSTIRNLTITGGGCGVNSHSGLNQNVNDVTITGNSNHGIIVESGSSITLENVSITENTAEFGAGISSNGTINMRYVLIARNVATGNYRGGGAIKLWSDATTEVNHATIVENIASFGGGIQNDATLYMNNSILRDNSPDQYWAENNYTAVYFSFSNIQTGEGQIITENGAVNWHAGNIDLDPHFCDPWESVYALAENSPCVGSGQDGSDMGAYGVGCTTVGVENGTEFPAEYALIQNYPNPFNPITTIRYELPQPSKVRLTVFDVLGQEVTTLQGSEQPPGHYEVQWNGMNDSGYLVSTGMYFCRLEAGAYSKTIKMIYIK